MTTTIEQRLSEIEVEPEWSYDEIVALCKALRHEQSFRDHLVVLCAISKGGSTLKAEGLTKEIRAHEADIAEILRKK